ncbi:hypothetical protein ACF0H5_008615 [Mactra antiquata]
MSDVCLLVLSGLPAAGKTHLTNKLLQGHSAGTRYAFVIVEYDQLIPSDVEKHLIESEDQQSSWKQYRESILLCIDHVLGILQTCQSGNLLELLDKSVENVPPDLWTKFKELMPRTLCDVNKDSKLCFVIDDNMYYSSMRYKYFQLARKYTTGFCQVHVHVDLKNALLQNSQRTAQVNEDVIVTMATKMEVPDKLKNSWEEHSLNYLKDETKVEEIVCLMDTACKNPVEPVNEDDIEQKEYCRLVCSESFLHQSDQILRKLVSQEMALASGKFSSKNEVKGFASVVQMCRKELYNKLKLGSINMPRDVVAMVTDSSKDTSSEMYKLLQELFQNELKEINR